MTGKITPEREILLESAVFAFLSHEEGSRIIKKSSDRFLVQIGGITLEQLKFHRRMILGTLGMWFPVYMVVAMLRQVRLVEITLHPTELRAITRELTR